MCAIKFTKLVQKDFDQTYAGFCYSGRDTFSKSNVKVQERSSLLRDLKFYTSGSIQQSV